MSTTYKGFLIESNLRCYLDQHGELLPMFPSTEFKTIEQAQSRIDKYWEQWQEQESRRRDINLQQSLAVLTDDLHDESQDQEQRYQEDKMNDYWEMQNIGE